MARVVPAFETFFDEIQVLGCLELPALTRFILAIPVLMWVLVGVLGAGLIIGKSYALSPKAARIVDGAALAGLAVMIAASALWLYVPLRKLRLSFRR